ncbi:MAG: PIN domain-containing protein [Chloroflexi bacterium]|nr:PIN domain-containing protein [Chloroflexota bacterium]
MSALLDTSVIVRYLTGDPPDSAQASAEIIDGEEELLVTDVVIAETAYVLTSVYRAPRETVVDHLIGFLSKANIDTFRLDKGVVLEALLLARPSSRVSFGDALVWAAARSQPGLPVYSFDRRFPGAGITVRGSAGGDAT